MNYVVMFVGLVTAAMIVALIYDAVRQYFPHLFERNTPEQKLFLQMLSDLADEEWCWEFSLIALGRYGISNTRTATHLDSGVSIKMETHSTMYSNRTFRVNVGGHETPFTKGSKGYMICDRIFAIAERADGAASLKARKERDLARLAAMAEAFKRMQAKG